VIESFNSFVTGHKLFGKSDKLLLAVSGGIDSMVMVDLFARSGYEFAIAHCNFKLRGEASDADEDLVNKLAKVLGVPLYSRAFETKKYAEKNGISIQMAARDLRYAYFEELCEQDGYDHLATAHHLDDQIETFFINLLRGTGIAGLHGIPLKNGKIVRPMLFAYRNDIEKYQLENKLEFREDESNLGVTYMRNKIRHELIPLLLELNPTFRQEMSSNIRRLAGTERVYRQVIELAAKEACTEKDGMIAIDSAILKLFKPVEQILYELIAPYGFRSDDINNILKALDGIPGKQFISPTHRLVIDRERMLITSIPGNEDEEYSVSPGDSFLKGPVDMKFNTQKNKNFDIPNDREVAAFDFDKLEFPLTIRRWKQGDSFIPLGMEQHKKLSDFFIDEKFSLPEKERTWVLCSGNEIAWIIGHRIANPFKITSDTKQIFLISSQ